MNIDELYMTRAIRLAKKAEGFTSPNPLVGAVIVKGDKIVGEGYHARCGLPHAEVNALRRARGRTDGATLYVTLEPCDHFGRTPPCTEAIIGSRIKKVVIGMRDPNPINNGRGARRLKSKGVEVVIGILGEEARVINRPYIKFITKRLPFVTVKVAESLDGKIAARGGDSKWITGEDSRQYVRRLRGKTDAVMVGINTVIKDDPTLLVSADALRQPLRIVLDTNLKIPLGLKLFSTTDRARLMVVTTEIAPASKRKMCMDRGAEIRVVPSKGGKVDLRYLLRSLAKDGIMHILVEGGGEVIASLVKEELADRFLFFIAPKIIGGRDAPTSVGGSGVRTMKDALSFARMGVKRFKKDILIEAEMR